MISRFHRFRLQNLTGATIHKAVGGETPTPAEFNLKVVKRSANKNDTVEDVFTYTLADDLANGESVVLTPTGTNTPYGFPMEIEGIATFIAGASNGAFNLYFESSPDGTLWPTLGKGKLVLTDTVSVSGTSYYPVKVS